MTQPLWTDIDQYITGKLVPDDPVLAAVLAANAAAGLPAHDVAPNQGKLLYLLARLMGARRILEIGTLGGYSTLWLARALPPGGRLTTLEENPHHAAMARLNFGRAGAAEMVDLREGPALETLPALATEGAGPFDLIFIDADKPNNPRYLKWALSLARPGSLIIGDNVIREGGILDEASADPRIQGVRRFIDLISAEPRLEATALQTVGVKGHDGFVIAMVSGQAVDNEPARKL
ncbi:O-methyltransferase [Emcibacter sp. SYSU 3D8]|uniref:O-methyltransferase n=1 Tax=Emcibacter sp. SYSU 3D8 TaxID=3133969 RepID=UPI0031FF2C78